MYYQLIHRAVISNKYRPVRRSPKNEEHINQKINIHLPTPATHHTNEPQLNLWQEAMRAAQEEQDKAAREAEYKKEEARKRRLQR